jgi:hypothetical protein
MTRRTHGAMLVAAVGLLVLAGSAGAVTSRTRACLFAAKRSRVNCTNTCRSDYVTNFQGCFGPGSLCAAACLNDQATCQTDPSNALGACKRDTLYCADGSANGVNGCTSATATNGGCATTLRSVLNDCTDPTKHPEGDAVCASNARLDNLRCQQGCQLVFAPALQACNQGFSDCTESCASCRNEPDCPSPAHRQRR